MKKKKVFNSIATGLKQAIDYEKTTGGETARSHKVTIHPLPEYQGETIKKLRLRLHLSQRTFAFAFGVSVKTVEAWEAGKNIPAGPAQRMLSLLEKDNSLFERYGIVNMQRIG